MKLKVFSVFDIKSELFSAPFYMNTAGEAVRAFRDLVNDKATMPGKYPADYKLVCLGSFDNESGIFDVEPQVSFGFGTDYVALASSVIPLGLAKEA